MVIARNQWTARDWGRPSRSRYLSVGLVVLFHIAAVYGLLVAIGFEPAIIPPTVFQVAQIAPAPPPVDKPLVPEPNFGQPVVRTTFTQFEPTIVVPSATQATAVNPPEQTAVLPAPATPSPAVAHTAARVDLGHSAKPLYPAISIRLGEQGTVIVSVLVSAQGGVLDAKVETSSGHARLDQAAIDGVRRGYHFIAATDGGKPIEMWQSIAVSFHLDDRN